MKKLYFTFLLSLALFSCNMDQSSEEVDDSDMVFIKLEIAVEGMTCEGCEKTVQTELSKLSGVKEVIASHTTKSVVLRADTTHTNIDKIEEEIERVGYTVIK